MRGGIFLHFEERNSEKGRERIIQQRDMTTLAKRKQTLNIYIYILIIKGVKIKR